MKLVISLLFILGIKTFENVIKCEEDKNIIFNTPKEHEENNLNIDNPLGDSGSPPSDDGTHKSGDHVIDGVELESEDRKTPDTCHTVNEVSGGKEEKPVIEYPRKEIITKSVILPKVKSSAEVAALKNPNAIEVSSALLKDQDGIKITGLCNARFQLFLVPHILINVETENNKIYLGKKFQDVIITKELHKGIGDPNERLQFEENPNSLVNKCAKGKTFKFVVSVNGMELVLKWKVYEKDTSETSNDKVDVRTYLIKNLGHPITAIQLHSAKGNNDSFLLESKIYILKNDIPEKCDLIATGCFLSGNIDIESCYKCALLFQNTDPTSPCFNYISPDDKETFEDIKTKAQDKDDPREVELEASIYKILKGVYKLDTNEEMDLINFSKADAALKEELLKYCSLMKELDTSGTLDNYDLGTVEEIYINLKKLLEENSDHDKVALKNKLKNAAICMKNTEEWVGNRKGLLLPILSNTKVDSPHYEAAKEEEKTLKTASSNEQNNCYDGVLDFVSGEESNMQSTHFTDSMFCNTEYCDRWKNKNDCLAKIEVEEQGNCATSWLFTSKLHLETIKCMKGYDHVPSSALYVANCSQKQGDAKCHAASNPLEYLNILDGEKFLPSASDMPYSYKLVGDVCPKPMNHWTNLWNNIKLLNHENVPNSVGTKGYTAYQSEHFKNNMDEFIKIVKSEVMKKGSVIAYVKTNQVMDYDINGKTVHGICGGEVPDLSVNIIGYGNYINAEGVKKSYWLLRNSWGKYWGDNGNFKVDMHTPAHCQHNFIHTAAVFNLDLLPFETVSKKNSELHNYYMKNSPDFYNNLYYMNLDAKEGSENGNNEKAKAHSSMVSGQEAEEDVESDETQSLLLDEGEDAAPVPDELATVTESIPEDVPERAKESEELAEKSILEPVTEPDARNPEQSQVVVPHANPRDSSKSVQEPRAATTHTHNISMSKIVQITEVIHILKHIKNEKLRYGIVTYEDDTSIAHDHNCSRSYAEDSNKLEECIQFCNDEWNNCKGDPSPGYCLAKRRKKNDCYFCFV
ncbi:serine-repeat antigen 1 [Plasmodium gonderi]|uniref:Putative papain-like cysteine prorease n=1 Tax=Plasmodium gonderi TaxID=77519 RepID=F1SZ28_PLAGO|nr:serine-repeat antigen 1 [Plasmodium gonderi]BAK08486.1 putative papain-like cysteine prorease [Plasmodium gonderi]GAW79527.1 serine-repeat antigen 1 [Plasmodium gonderi]